MNLHTILLSALTTAEKLSYSDLYKQNGELSTNQMLGLSGEMLLRGMGTVFMVLIILWGILTVFGAVFSKGVKSKDKPVKVVAEKKNDKPSINDKPAKKAETQAVQPAAQDDSALIAAITAAIIAYNAAEGKPNLPFRVVSFKRKNNAAGWIGNTADNQ